jgi:hypothetical protein
VRAFLRRFAEPRLGLEPALLAAVLAATLAALLLVAKNHLTPLQRPLTFGLVFWGWFLGFYLAIALAGALGVGLIARLTRLTPLPGVALALAILVFLGAALGWNRGVLPMLVELAGPWRFRWLVPASALVSVLGLLWLATAPWRTRALARVLAVLAAAAGVVGLLPASDSAGAPGSVPGAARVPSGERLLVVGIDGADWDYIDPLIARGELPNLAALRRRGAWGELETLRPTLSPPIWTSIVTGKTPDEHGVKGFLSSYLRGVDDFLPRLRPVWMVGFGPLQAGLERAGQVYETGTNDTRRRVPAFWNIASAHGSPVNVVSWWATWPAEPVLGRIVSEALHSAPPRSGSQPPVGQLTYPEDLYGELARDIMRPDEMTLEQARLFLDLEPDAFAPFLARQGTGIDRELTYYFSYFETTRRVVLHLFELDRARGGSASDTVLLFRIVDKTCHTSLRDSELVAERVGAPAERVRRYGRVVTGAYRVVDRALGEILAAFGDASVVVVSDHGFSAYPLDGRPEANHKNAPGGIFIAAGAPFQPGRVQGLSIYDVLPLLLYVKGLPVADDFVEELDERLIAGDFLARHPIRRVASYGRRAPRGAVPRSDPAADAEALDHLRTLGYIQ